MSFKNKSDLVAFIKNQTNVELANTNDRFNGKRNVLYTEINRQHKNNILSLLNKYVIWLVLIKRSWKPKSGASIYITHLV